MLSKTIDMTFAACILKLIVIYLTLAFCGVGVWQGLKDSSFVGDSFEFCLQSSWTSLSSVIDK